MRFILHADMTRDTIGGRDIPQDYQNVELLNAFEPVLAAIGAVDRVEDPATEADPIFEACRARGEECVLLSFALPHRLPEGLRCPTVAVFAWGYSSIPDAAWAGNPRNDWRASLASCGRAIVLSGYAAQTVRTALGDAFPVSAILPPLSDAVPAPSASCVANKVAAGCALRGRAHIADTLTGGFTAEYLIVPVRPFERQKPPFVVERASAVAEAFAGAYGHLQEWRKSARRQKAAKGPLPKPEFRIEIAGVIYTSVLNPNVDSKAWRQMLTAFCWAFRETSDATLVLNMTAEKYDSYRDTLIQVISRLTPFRCRIVVIHGALEESEYEKLRAATSFYVNSSECEAVCRPMMDFMAAGVPALAPNHTALADYIDPDTAFIVETTRQTARWPHDPRKMLHSQTFRLNWETLLAGFRDSYRLANSDPERYAAMSQAAEERIRNIASRDVVSAQLSEFFGLSRLRDSDLGSAVTEAAV